MYNLKNMTAVTLIAALLTSTYALYDLDVRLQAVRTNMMVNHDAFTETVKQINLRVKKIEIQIDDLNNTLYNEIDRKQEATKSGQ